MSHPFTFLSLGPFRSCESIKTTVPLQTQRIVFPSQQFFHQPGYLLRTFGPTSPSFPGIPGAPAAPMSPLKTQRTRQMKPTHRNTHTHTHPNETIWHLRGHTCSPFLPGRPDRPWTPASPWTRTLRSLWWTTKDCSSCHSGEQGTLLAIIRKYNHWIKAQESLNTHGVIIHT